MKKTIVFAVIVILGCQPSKRVMTNDIANTYDPVNIVQIKHTKGKPPLNFHRVNMSVNNKYQHPIWIALPCDIGKKMSSTIDFKNQTQAESIFSSRLYQNGSDYIVEICIECLDGMQLFHIPSGSTANINELVLTSTGEVDAVEVWLARDVFVDSCESLSDYLSIDTQSSPFASVAVDRGSGNYKSLIGKYKKMLDEGMRRPASSIEIDVIQKYNVIIADK